MHRIGSKRTPRQMGCYGGFITEEREGDSRTDKKHRDHTRARVCSEALVLSTYKIALLLRLFEVDALGTGSLNVLQRFTTAQHFFKTRPSTILFCFIHLLFINSENVVGRSLNLLALQGPPQSAFGSGCSGGWRRSGFAVEHEVNALLEPSSELLLRPVFGEVEPARMHTCVIYMWLQPNPHLHTNAI